jgi:hypothetical protein
MKTIAIWLICLGHLLAYEVQIVDSLRIDKAAAKHTFLTEPIEGETTLLDYLGGDDEIEKIVLCVMFNKNHGELTKAIVHARIAQSVCKNTQKDHWSYAPFAIGTIHFVGGRQHAISLHLSGISIAGHLFAPQQKIKMQNKPDMATPRRPSD